MLVTKISPEQIQVKELVSAPEFVASVPTKDSSSTANVLDFLLDNGTLTLKAGAKIYIPQGLVNSEFNFSEVTTEQDLTISNLGTYTNTFVIFYSNGALFASTLDELNSGTSNISTIYNALYWKTDTNYIYYRKSQQTVQENVSLPLAIVYGVKATGANYATPAFIEKVLDKCGYVGRMVFVRPNVTVQIPNGYKEGSLNYLTYTTDKVFTNYLQQGNSYFHIALGPSGLVNNTYYFKIGNNMFGSNNQYSPVLVYPVAECYVSENFRITSFQYYNENKPLIIKYPITYETTYISIPAIYHKVPTRDFKVYVNGQLVTFGAIGENDYTVSGSSITFNYTLPEGTIVEVEVF